MFSWYTGPSCRPSYFQRQYLAGRAPTGPWMLAQWTNTICMLSGRQFCYTLDWKQKVFKLWTLFIKGRGVGQACFPSIPTFRVRTSLWFAVKIYFNCLNIILKIREEALVGRLGPIEKQYLFKNIFRVKNNYDCVSVYNPSQISLP